MCKSKIKQISLAVCLAFMPFSVYAAGLGKLNVNSGLGEPLKADIELLSVSPEELSTLVASIASQDAYATQGITRLSIHNNIKVELTKNANGSPLLKLRSTQPISDPYLDMLIQVDWANGRLQREYTILLDPPGYKNTVDNAPAIPVQAPSVNASEFSSAPGVIPASNNIFASDQQDFPKPTKKSKKQQRRLSPIPASNNSLENSAEQDVVTKRGDTLISVAKDLQVEGVSLDQMLIGLYEYNKNAFTSNNMNRLKVGQIIKLPSKEVLTAVDLQEAKQSIKVHSSNWNAYRNAVAANVAKTPAVSEAEQKQSVSGKIATAEDKAAPVKTGPQDVVKLSAGEKEAIGKSAKDVNKAFDAKIVALQDESTAREKSLKEAQERTKALEKQIEDMQKLLALKSQSMTQLQKNAAAATNEASVKIPVQPPVVAADVKPKETPKAEVATEVFTKPHEVAPVVVSEVAKVIPTPKAKEPATTQVAPAEEIGLLERLINSVDLLVLGGASGVALLVAGWMFLRNKRRKDLDSFERGILTSGGLRANTVLGNITGNASTSDTSFLTDFSQNADGSMIDTNDVDPIAEAEVYMAYGRDAQAEEILKDAILKEPKRYELHLKLLEMYAGRKDYSAFEAIAGELYTTLGADDPTWAKVAKMGSVIEPENPLYDVRNLLVPEALLAQSVTASVISAAKMLDSEVASSDSDFDFDFSIEPETKIAEAVKVDEDTSILLASDPEAEVVADQAMSFDIDTLNIASDSASFSDGLETPAPDNSIAFDLTDANLGTAEVVAVEVPTQEIADDNSMDFDLADLTKDEPAVPAQLNTANASATSDVADIFNDDVSALPVDISRIDISQADIAAPVDQTSVESTNLDIDFTMPEDNLDLNANAQAKLNPLADISFEMDDSLDESIILDEVDQVAGSVESVKPVKSTKAVKSVKSIKPAKPADVELEVINDVSVSRTLAEAEDIIFNDSVSDDLVSNDLASNDLASNDLASNDLETEISFDLPDEEEAVVNDAAESQANDFEANTFDLSSINLDLGDTEVETFPDASSPAPASEIEPPDVNVKLDLVAAYIDMEDKEGAIELLEEVIKEGGVNQKARAQQLLDSLA